MRLNYRPMVMMIVQMMMIIIFGQGYELMEFLLSWSSQWKGLVPQGSGDNFTSQECETALTSQFGTHLAKVKIDKVLLIILV